MKPILNGFHRRRNAASTCRTTEKVSTGTTGSVCDGGSCIPARV
jgi:hypothetical protein